MKAKELIAKLLDMNLDKQIVVEANGQVDLEITEIAEDRSGNICIKILVDEKEIEF